MSSISRIGLVVTVAFFMTATSHAANCTNPANGPRDCDYVDTDCPQTISGIDSSRFHSDYASFIEAECYLNNLLSVAHDSDGYMALIDLGESYWLETFASLVNYEFDSGPVLVARITEDARLSDTDRPKILMVCGVHASEWIPQEVCLSYVDWLVQSANNNTGYTADNAEVVDLLSRVEIWAVVQASPGGRMYDEYNQSVHGTGVCESGASNYQRKNRQWFSDFICNDDWSGYARSGNCSQGQDWYRQGVNIARNFSYAWPLKEDESYTRERIFPGYGHESQYSPEEYDCDGVPANCSAFGDHDHCLEYCLDTGCLNRTHGCFMEDSFDIADFSGCLASSQFDSNNILHASCLLVRTPPPVGDRYFLFECGNAGSIPLVPWNHTSTTCSWPYGTNELLKNCRDGVLVSCASAADCTGIADGEFTPATSVHRSPNRYCGADRYCAVSNVNSCCGSNYRGARPFESVESRIIRELVNNVPFAFVLDMHSSRSDLGYRCIMQGGGCGGTNRSYLNGRGLESEMAVAYNDAAQDEWQSVYPGDPLPLFITLDPIPSGSGGSGQLPGWTANKPTTVFGVEALFGQNPTFDNFDNGTLRAVSSFTWELGSKDWNSSYPTTPVSFGDLLGCDSTSTQEQGCRPRSTLMTINQVEGAKGLMSYLADQAQTPGAGSHFGTGVPLTQGRRDAAVVGLKIHDGHGRGVQQSELRWTEIGDDPTAEIIIPAGYWTVTTEVATASYLWPLPDIFTIQGSLDVSTENQIVGGWGPPDFIIDNEGFLMANGERKTFSRKFHFEAGETYRVIATVGNTATADNDTNANDKIIMKFKVLDCLYGASIPNGLGSDAFCQKGLPFESTRFECRDVGNIMVKGVCQECWLDPLDQQMCLHGALCVDGMCDDTFDCISGQTEDIWEGVPGFETVPWVALSNDDQSALLPRTLHRDADALGIPVQDIDTLEVRASASFDSDTYSHTLNLKVVNNCSTGLFIIGTPVEDLKAKIQRPSSSSSGFGIPSYEDLTGWVDVIIGTGLDVILPGEVITMMASGRKVRVLLKNDDIDPQSFPYRVTVGLSSTAQMAGPPPAQSWAAEWPWEIAVSPWQNAIVATAAKETRVYMPTIEGIEQEGHLYFLPDEGIDITSQNAWFILRDNTGEIAVDDQGVQVGYGTPYHGGLAVDLAGLVERNGPYKGYLMRDDGPLRGKVYLCEPGTDDCSVYNPARSACGQDCDGEGETCCIDDNGDAVCTQLLGSDEENCGGCDRTCEWDEVCLEGVCARGLGLSCWETECPEKMFCVSDNWWWRTNPRCKSILVDNEYCGLWGDTCGDNEICTLGLCLPKTRLPCEMECVEGESCCWVWGVETCIDTENSFLHCGVCGNHCEFGTLCQEGVCEAWYDVLDPCLGDTVNCGRGGEISCLDLSDDPDNCGSCGFDCPDDGWCEDGRCMVEGIETGVIDD